MIGRIKHVLALASAALLAGCAAGEVGKISLPGPFTRTVDSFEGPFIDKELAERGLAPLGAFVPGQTAAPQVSRLPVKPVALKAFSGDTEPSGEVNPVLAIENAVGFVDDAKLRSYLHGIAAKCLAHWPLDKPELQVFVTTSKSYNAYATPTGEIFIPVGLLRGVESEDELAHILCHETAHVLLNHFERDEIFQDQREAAGALASAALVAAVVATSGTRKKADGSIQIYTKDQEGLQDRAMQTAIAYAAVDFASQSLDASWNRKQEDEADLLGLDLAIRAGYQPKGAFQSLERMHDFQGEAETRLQKLDRQAEMLGEQLAADFSLGGAMASMATVFTGAVLAGVGDLVDKLKGTHREQLSRRDDLKTYVKREYRKHRRTKLKREEYQRAILLGPTAAILANHIIADEANDALAEGDIVTAEKKALQAISGPTANMTWPRTVMYMVRKTQGDDARARANLDKIGADQVKPIIVYDLMVTEYLAAGQKSRAARLMEEASGIFGRKRTLPNRIQIAAAEDRAGDAVAFLDECRASKDSTLIKRCESKVVGMELAATADAKTDTKEANTLGSIFNSFGQEAPELPDTTQTGDANQTTGSGDSGSAGGIFGGLKGVLGLQ